MEPFTFSEVRGFRVRLFKPWSNVSRPKVVGFYSFEDATGFLWPDGPDLAANASAAKTVIMTAADWEFCEIVVEGWIIINH